MKRFALEFVGLLGLCVFAFIYVWASLGSEFPSDTPFADLESFLDWLGSKVRGPMSVLMILIWVLAIGSLGWRTYFVRSKE